MSELVVIITVCGLSLALTAFLGRGAARSGTTPHDLERMLAAVQRACADFLWQETRLLAALLAIVLAAVAAGAVAFGVLPEGHGALAWALGALCLGALAGVLVAHVAHSAAARTARAALEALRHDRDGAARATLRGAALHSVAIDGVSSCLAVLAFGAHYAYLTAARQVEAHHAAVLASRTLAMLALGASCAAVVFQIGGASLHTAAGVAATGARVRHPNIARDEERNPVLVAELVGDHAGGLVSCATDALAGFLLGNAAVVMLGALVSATNASAGAGAIAFVALPLLIRTLGQLAASIALCSSRLDGNPNPAGVLLLARLSHALLLGGGVLGACLWLLGAAALGPFMAAGSLGVLAGVLSAFASAAGAPPELEAMAPSRAEASVARAVGLGLQRTWILFLLVGACLGGAWWLGTRTGLVNGGVFALTLAVAALLGAGAFNNSHGAFAVICENVRRVAALRRARFDERARKRAAALERAGVTLGYLGRTQSILGAAAAALLAALMLPLARAGGAAKASADFALGHPVVLLGGVLGAGALLSHVGGMLRASSRAAAALDRDISDRLAQEEGSGEQRSVPPGYRASVQLATAGATEALLPLALGAVLAPFALAVLLRLAYGAQSGGVGVRGLTAFSALAALTGCCAALVAQGAAVELAAARRANADGAPSTSAIEFMERCIGPAALLGLKATVVSALAAVPLLF